MLADWMDVFHEFAGVADDSWLVLDLGPFSISLILKYRALTIKPYGLQ